MLRSKPFLLGILTAAFMLIAARCSSSQVRTQAMTAEAVARTFNRALPVWLDVAEHDCADEVDRALPGHAEEAATACEAKWRNVSLAWEATRASHNTWRLELLRCLALEREAPTDGGMVCQASLGSALSSFMQNFNEFRCALKATGHMELDTYEGDVTCNATDAGVTAHE
jgi:hypothetical protein